MHGHTQLPGPQDQQSGERDCPQNLQCANEEAVGRHTILTIKALAPLHPVNVVTKHKQLGSLGTRVCVEVRGKPLSSNTRNAGGNIK